MQDSVATLENNISYIGEGMVQLDGQDCFLWREGVISSHLIVFDLLITFQSLMTSHLLLNHPEYPRPTIPSAPLTQVGVGGEQAVVVGVKLLPSLIT